MEKSPQENIIQINEENVKSKLEKIVKETVEETLNRMLDEEADLICNAKRYEHSEERNGVRAGYYKRDIHLKNGVTNLKIPKLKHVRFETAIIERYKRRESSVEEAMMEMYLAGVSVRRVEDITEALWGTRVSAGTISNLNQQIYEKIDNWRNRPIQGEFPYVYLDGIVLKRTWADEVKNVSILVAFGVDKEGYREILGACEGAKEDKQGWSSFLESLKVRGLKGVRLIISDKCLGLIESIADYFPEADWQRCIVHFYRNVFTHVPSTKVKEVAAMLKAIHLQEDKEAMVQKGSAVIEKLEKMKLSKASKTLKDGLLETLSYTSYPREHWRSIRTNNPMERIMREIRRRTRVVGNFPDGNSALMLVSARLRYMTGKTWGTKRYLNMNLLKEIQNQKEVDSEIEAG